MLIIIDLLSKLLGWFALIFTLQTVYFSNLCNPHTLENGIS